MSLNEGKQEIKYHDFLGEKYRIDRLPCGVSIPFNIELDKLRKSVIDTVCEIDDKTKSKDVYAVLNKYLSDNVEEAVKHMNQIIKVVSVITEFYTDGEVNEDYIRKNATEEEVAEFIEAIQLADYETKVKKLKRIRKNLL